ncbi:MAG: M1 family aminopeptidase, partial [Thermoanaerobaculia bacterium]|nr:M1 family aminopeptidase [Thermoanaerobaculia bacterium]
MTEALPSYLVALAVGPFEPVPAGSVGDTPLGIVALRGKADRAAWAREVTHEILQVHEEYLGIAYPYEKLDSVAIPKTIGFGAMENVGLMTYSESLLLIPEEELTVGRKRSYASVAAHEIAHQWFGNYVSPAWWDDIWLNESFASWMGRKVIHEMRPEWEFDVSGVGRASRSMAWDTRATATAVVPEIETEHDIETAFSSITYGKGSTLLGMFEGWMGEAAFRRGVRTYLQRHAHGNATSSDFLAALEEPGPDGVASAFRTFIEQPGVPLVTVGLACADEGSPRLELAQERLLPLGSKAAADLLWEIPVCYRWGGSETEAGEECTLVTGKRTSEPLPTDTCPEWVFGNAGGRGYYRVRYENDLLARLPTRDTGALRLTERVSLVRDIVELADAGRIPIEDALAVVESLPSSPSRHLVSAVANLLRDLEERVPPDLQARYAAFVRSELGPLARELGFVPEPDEDPEVRLLRETVVPLVADVGNDPELRSRAGRLARSWLEDRTAVDPDLAGTVLRIAAEDGDEELFERFLAEIPEAEERRNRRRLFRALGSFTDPTLRDRAWTLFFEEGFDLYEATGLLTPSFGEPESRDRAWSRLRERFGEIAERLPPQWAASLPFWVADFCDSEHRREVETFFRGRMEEFPGGPRRLDQAVESIELCTAGRDHKVAGIRAFFEQS